MKKHFSIPLAVMLALLLTSCNKTQVNLYGYTHKPAVIFSIESDANEQINDLLNGTTAE